jgi:hypothetical protein
MPRRSPTLAALATLAVLAATSAGCYGQFALTRKLYDWNGRATGNQFANSAIMWVMLIVPVYPIAGLADIVVFNTIEAFTGDNPIAATDGAGRIVLHHQGHEYRYRREGEAVVVERDGMRALRYFRHGEHVVVEDAGGRVVRTLAAPAEARTPTGGTRHLGTAGPAGTL